MKPSLGLPDDARDAVARILNTLLADEYVLYTKTRNFHWNVAGPNFVELHKFFQAQYEQLDASIDEIAERVRSLGGIALGSLAEFSSVARLKEGPSRLLNGREMIVALLADHEAVIRQLREDVAAADQKHRDAGTADFLTGLMEQHEKTAWMLRAYLEG